jgi:hypothetical protein
VYLIEHSGVALLEQINIEKSISKVDSQHITITFREMNFNTDILK